MSEIEARGDRSYELNREFESTPKPSQKNNYPFHVGLKDLDFDIDEDRIKKLGLKLPFQSIDQAEQALQCHAIMPIKFIEYDDTVHQVLIFDHRSIGYSGFMNCVTHSLALTSNGLFEVGRYPALNLISEKHYWQWFLHRRLATPEEISDALDSQNLTIDQYMENIFQTITSK